MKPRRFVPRLWSLETRDVPAAVSWDGGAGTLNWNDALNWSTNALPGASDDVTLNASGTVTIQYGGGATTLASLALSDSLNLTAGSIAVSGTVSAANVAVTAKNPGTAFSAIGTVTADGSNFVADSGGLVDLPGLTSYQGSASKSTFLDASGVGSKLSFAGLTTLNGSTSSVAHPFVRALSGGLIEIPSLVSITSGHIDIEADGASSKIDAPLLTTVAPAAAFVDLFATAGGTLNVPLLTQLSRTDLTVDGTGATPTSQLTQLTDGTLVVEGGTYTFPVLTNFNGGAMVSGGASVTLGAVSSYTGTALFATFIEASGTGSQLSLPNLLTFKGSNHSIAHPHLRALASGTVSVPLLAEITSGHCELKADGTGSVLSLPALTKIDIAAGAAGDVIVTKSGTLTAPLLGQFGRTSLTLDGTGVWPTAQLTQFLDGQMSISGGVFSLTNLTSFNGGVAVSGGADVTLAGVTSYQGSATISAAIEASGAGSKLAFPNLTTFKGSTHPVLYPRVRALSGGNLSLPLVSAITFGNSELKADGASSVLSLPALTKIDIAASLSSSVVVTKSGTLDAPLLAEFGRTNLTLDGTGVWPTVQFTRFTDAQLTVTGGVYSLANLATFNGGTAVSGAADVTMGAVTAYEGSTVLGSLLTSSGAGSKLAFPNLTSFKGSTHPVLFPKVRALSGGTVAMPLVSEVTVGNSEFKSDGAGSTLSMPALTRIQITGGLDAELIVTAGGTMDSPLLTKLDSTHVTIDGTGSSPINQLTEVLDGQITVTGGTYNLTNLVTFNGGVATSGGAVVTLPTITAYEGSAEINPLLQASGAGSQLLLPNLTMLKGSTHPALYPRFKALSGGYVSVPLVTEVTSGHIDFAADGTGSEVSVPLLAKVTLPSNQDGFISADNNGKVTTATSLTIGEMFLTRNPTGVFTFNSLNALSGSLVAIEGAITADMSIAAILEVRTNITAGSTSIMGNLTLAPTSTVRVDLGGLTAGTQFNQFNVSGTVALAGTLDLAYFNSFTPALGNSFDVITGGSVTGFFSNHVDLNVSAAVELTPSYPTGKVVLTAVTAAGPRIVAQSPAGTVTSPLAAIDVTFNEPMNAPSFTASDVNFTGPGGTVTISSITQLATDTFRLHFGTLTKNGTYTLKVGPSITDAAGINMDQNTNGTKNENPGDVYTSSLTLAVAPPRVSGVVVNGGGSQRSMVTSLVVNFDTTVNLPVAPETAFTLTRQSTSETVSLSATVVNGTATTVTLTFTGGPLEGASLADGRYTLTVIAASVTDAMGQELDGNADLTPGDDYVVVGTPAAAPKLYRQFGDTNGDGFTDNVDLIAFRQANGSDTTMVNYNPILDVNGDGFIDNVDFIAFRQRIGVPA